MALDSVKRMVSGKLSASACDKLHSLVEGVPDGGAILDLYCGEGLSTIVMAEGLKYYRKTQVTIVALDTHISDPLSDTPHEDGTVLTMLRNLRRFKALQYVIPIIASTSAYRFVVDKKSTNLVVVQAPVISPSLSSALHSSLEVARLVIRSGGRVVVCKPHRYNSQEFFDFVGSYFGQDFVLIDESPEMLVYENTTTRGR